MAAAMRFVVRMLAAAAVLGCLSLPSAPAAQTGAAPVLRHALTVDTPALDHTYQPGVAWEWQWDAARMGDVPDAVLRAAARVKRPALCQRAMPVELSAPRRA